MFTASFVLFRCLDLTVPHHLRQERTSNTVCESLKSCSWSRLDHQAHLLLLLALVSLHLHHQLPDLGLELIVQASELSCTLLHADGNSL